MPRGTIQTVYKPEPGGVREDVSPVLIPDGSLVSSNNVLTRRGIRRPRPGYDLSDTTADGKRITHIGFRGSRHQSTNIVLFTTDNQYSWNGNSLTSVTRSGWTASGPDQLSRSCTFSQGGTDYLMAVNPENTVQEWTGSGNFTATTGGAPNGKDILVLGNRLLVIAPSDMNFTVEWSGFKDRTSWSSSVNRTLLQDTQGSLVGGLPFSPNTAAIYKDDSVYLATVQAAVEPFQFQFSGLVPGPLSPAIIVNALGVHYWMGEDFSIYKFDGAEPKLVSSGLVRTIARNINYSDKGAAFGFSSITQDYREVWLFYPNRTGRFNAISCNIVTGAVNHHEFGHTITAAADWRMGGATIDGLDTFSSTIDALDTYASSVDGLDGAIGVESIALFGDSSGRLYTMGAAFVEDNGTAIPWTWEEAWVAPGQNQTRVQLDAVQTYWKDLDNALTITVTATTTDKLNDLETGTAVTFNAGTDEQHLLTFPNKRGKLVKLRYEGAVATQNLEYRGALMTSWPRGRV